MSWTRGPARPATYKGIRFRSGLEADVARALDQFSVTWEYELPAHEAMLRLRPMYAASAAPPVRYLPDFTIVEAPDDLALPMFVEVKPAELLYALRDRAGCPERFEGTRQAQIDANTLHSEGFDEVWKPKALAELYQVDVLITARLNATSSVSVLATPTGLEFSKSHPAVNRRGVLARQERDRRWAEMAELQAVWRAQREAESVERATRFMAAALTTPRRNARLGGLCGYCQTQQPAAALDIFRPAGSAYWEAICRSHLKEGT